MSQALLRELAADEAGDRFGGLLDLCLRLRAALLCGLRHAVHEVLVE